jgi:glycyl-tRNA synthetase
VVQILVRQQLDVDLKPALAAAAAVQPIPVDGKTIELLLEFITGRLDAWLEEETTAPRDVVRAVLAAQGTNPARAYRYIGQLAAWVQRSDWALILDNFARCVRITRPEKQRYALQPAALVEPQEQALYAACQQVTAQITPASSVDDFLHAFAPIVPAIQAFFDAVLVHAEDPAVRQNRLALLQTLSALQDGRADLSELSGF